MRLPVIFATERRGRARKRFAASGAPGERGCKGKRGKEETAQRSMRKKASGGGRLQGRLLKVRGAQQERAGFDGVLMPGSDDHNAKGGMRFGQGMPASTDARFEAGKTRRGKDSLTRRTVLVAAGA